jgi:hypothetical protein
MCFGMTPTEEKNTTQNSVTTQSGAANTSATGASNTGSFQNTLGSTTGSSNQATAGSSLGNTSNLTAGQTSATANPAIEAAALGNLDFANSLQGKGFQGYTGQQVANFSPDQQASFGLTNAIVGNGTAPAAGNLINQYAGAPAQNVQAQSIASNMSPYMNQYLMQALAPQLQQMDIANAKTRHATDANATGSGAFGDARTGIEQANNSFNANLAREGVIGNAYNSAFNTAIGAGAQDASNNLAAGNANAGYNESALARALGGSAALQGLQNQQLGVAQAQNTAGAQQTAQQQAALTAQYNQWLMAQQYPFQTAGLVNSTVGQAASALPATTNTVGSNIGSNLQNTLGTVTGSNVQNTAGSTVGGSNTATSGTTAGTTSGQSVTDAKGFSETQKPDNSGLALLGSIAGTAGKIFI